ncbi:MAG: hypothetical protein ACMXYK_01890 [Candidatus Woesearchaeota archaeon]
MGEIISTLEPLFENQQAVFGIRELARLTGINHTTIRQRLLDYEKKGFVQRKSEGHFVGFSASESHAFILLKKYYNMKKIYDSQILDFLNKFFDFPTIVLFGSYPFAEDVATSDIDICVISAIEKGFLWAL